MMPVLFFGHGNPMNALARNNYTEAWQRIGATVTRPKAILAISAHWYGPGTAVTASPAPRTTHDFGGFPDALFQMEYPAPGSPELASRVQQLVDAKLDDSWGLDHGTWAVLCHVYPEADIPIVQLSLDANQSAAWHYELGRRLAPLREEGVLIAGSGNLVHNLRAYGWGKAMPEPYDWAARFETQARALILAGDTAPLIDYETLGPDAMLSVPTPERYLPLLYVLALRKEGESISFPVEGFEGGSMSMLAVQVGA
jgi:4,5-DOPA dioxygenase extradiol